MTSVLAHDEPKVTDLRGSAAVPRGSAVLEDPTGRRRRRLRFLGRFTAIALTLWLAALVLGGLGLNPVAGIPFSRALRPATAPPQLTRLPKPVPAAPADRRLAAPAPNGTGVAPLAVARQPVAVHRTRVPGPTTNARRPRPERGSAPVAAPVAHPQQPTPTKPATTHPNSGRHTGTQPSTTTTTTTTTTTPGRSGVAPGHGGTAPGRPASTTP